MLNKANYARLSAFYGRLLTERQQAVLALSCDEDLSLAEIAQQFAISRQAVSDTLQKAYQRLDQLEEDLGLVARYDSLTRRLDECRQLVHEAAGGRADQNLAKTLQILDDILTEEGA